MGRLVCDRDFVPCAVSIVTYGLYGLLVTLNFLFINFETVVLKTYDRLIIEEDFDATGKRELGMRSREAANRNEKVSDSHIHL